MNDRVLFTWPDAVFSYECRGCSACCKGLGIGLDATRGELERLLHAHPSLAPFAQLRGETWTFFNPRGRCWFLDDDGWCRVERDDGRDAKPASCRLFPFNRVFRAGRWRIVDFNSVICPLRAAPPGATDDAVGLSGRVRHVDVLTEIQSIQDPAVVGTPLEITGDLDVDTLFNGERAIADACFSLARDPARSPEALWAALGGRAEHGEATRAALSEALDALGFGRAMPPPELDQTALWLAPSLRFNELFGPRRYAETDALRRVLPSMLWTWRRLLASGATLAERPLTLQESTSAWSALAPITYALARWTSRPFCEPGAIALQGAASSLHSRVLDVGRRLVAAAAQAPSQRQTLGDHVLAASHDLAPHARAALLRQLEPLLGRLRFGNAAAPTRKRSLGRKTKRR